MCPSGVVLCDVSIRCGAVRRTSLVWSLVWCCVMYQSGVVLGVMLFGVQVGVVLFDVPVCCCVLWYASAMWCCSHTSPVCCLVCQCDVVLFDIPV